MVFLGFVACLSDILLVFLHNGLWDDIVLNLLSLVVQAFQWLVRGLHEDNITVMPTLEDCCLIEVPIIEVDYLIQVFIMFRSGQLDQGLLCKHIGGPLIENSFLILKIFLINLAEESGQKSPKLRSFPYHRSSITPTLKDIHGHSVLGSSCDFLLQGFIIDEDRIEHPGLGIAVDCVYKFKGLFSDYCVIGVDVQDYRVRGAVLSDALVTICQGIDAFLVLDNKESTLILFSTEILPIDNEAAFICIIGAHSLAQWPSALFNILLQFLSGPIIRNIIEIDHPIITIILPLDRVDKPLEPSPLDYIPSWCDNAEEEFFKLAYLIFGLIVVILSFEVLGFLWVLIETVSEVGFLAGHEDGVWRVAFLRGTLDHLIEGLFYLWRSLLVHGVGLEVFQVQALRVALLVY